MNCNNLIQQSMVQSQNGDSVEDFSNNQGYPKNNESLIAENETLEASSRMSLNFHNKHIRSFTNSLPKYQKIRKPKVKPIVLNNVQQQIKCQQQGKFKQLKIRLIKVDAKYSLEQTTEGSVDDSAILSDVIRPKKQEMFKKADVRRFMKHFNYNSYFERIDANYLSTVQSELNPKSRIVLINYMLLICKKLKLSVQTLITAIHTMDAFCSIENLPSIKFQLFAVTCLFLASKFVEVCPAKTKHLVSISNNKFTAAEIVDFEAYILNTVGFRIVMDSPLQFLELKGLIEGQSECMQNLSIAYLISTCYDVRMYAFKTKQLVEDCVSLAQKSYQCFYESDGTGKSQDQVRQMDLGALLADSCTSISLKNIGNMVINLERLGLFSLSQIYEDLKTNQFSK